MEILPRQLLIGVCAITLAISLANAETSPIVVGLAKCSDCTRKTMNAEAAFRGLLVAVKCKNNKGEYESKAVGQVDKSGAFNVPLTGDLVGEDGELNQECFAQLHSASMAPCPGQEPSKIVAAQPSYDGKKTFVALAGKMHQPSAECSSVSLCDSFHMMNQKAMPPMPLIVPPKHHGHSHRLPPAIKPPVKLPPKHDHDHDHDHDNHHSLPAAPTPTPIYHSAQHDDAFTDPQLFKKLLPFLKKLPFFPPSPPAELKSKPFGQP